MSDVTAPFGERLPELRTAVPGPASRALAVELAAVESRNITRIAEDGPIFWAEARGANVRDADGNTYVDLTGGFSVAAAGHGNPRVAAAVAEQASRLAHGLGDVYPPDIKVRLLRKLAELAPGELGVTILANSGAEAVEAALKTAVMRTGRPGILAFEGAYHGLTYGALATTWRGEFRGPFEAQLYRGVRFVPYPRARAGGDPASGAGDVAAAALAAVDRVLREAARSSDPIGAVIVEPIQGRGGLVVPPDDFLPGLRELCDAHGAVLILDEIYTGFGRTGQWFACMHTGVVPDVLVVGKALTGMLPLSAAIGTRDVMDAWPPSTGEAIHTSTFLGNPIACAAALAQIAELEERRLVERAARLGAALRERLERWPETYEPVAEVRGRGLLLGVELVEDRTSRRPAAALAARIVSGALRRGVILLAEGPHANVLAFTPPLVITEAQLHHAVDVVEDELRAALRP
ncbi:MAG TPA: aspartate aminotransferase family protein [Longimicrobiales bacterium]|nr:aspartate aminotransferase family protein [Longimicrobiales bacterium]